MSPRPTRLAAVLAACLLPACASVPGPGSAPVAATPDAGVPATPPPPVAEPVPVASEEPADAVADGEPPAPEPDEATPPTLTGLQVYESFLAGLAEPGCNNAQPRWLRHFAQATERVGDPGSDTSALFAHVVQSLRQAGLPTEFALIPFVESGYRPGARSKAGPAGLWQFVTLTARDHGLPVSAGYDARLSPAASTRAAVQYLGTLYQRFGHNWRLALMGYNAGEFRVRRALVRSGADAADATPGHLPGLSPITYAYVEKLHALACLLEQAGERPQWRTGLDYPVMQLRAQRLEGARSLQAWAAGHGQDPALLLRLNPGLGGTWPADVVPLALVPGTGGAVPPVTGTGPAATPAATVAGPGDGPATHRVKPGDSAWSIARRHGTSVARLLELNGLHARSVLQPGMVLKVR